MIELDTVIALANLTYDVETDTYELHPSDEKVFNDFITKNPWFDIIHIRAIFLHFQTFVHILYTIYVFVFGPLCMYENVSWSNEICKYIACF